MPVVHLIKRLLNDANFNVQVGGIKVAGLIGLGLRKIFNQGAKILFGLILQKFKDKRTILITETQACLFNMFHSVQFDEIWESFKEGITDKTPTVRVQTFILLEKYFDQFSPDEVPEKQKEVKLYKIANSL